MKKKIIISLFIGIIFSTAAMYMAFRNIPLNELISYLQTVNYFWFLPALILGVFSFFIRVLRWKTIVNSVSPVSFMGIYHPLMTGFMLNCILPGRIGEIARPAILLKQEKIPFSTGMGTVVAERAFDLISLIILFTLLISQVDVDPDLAVTFGNYELSAAIFESVCSGILKVAIVLIAGIILINIKSLRNIMGSTILSLPSCLFFLNATAKKSLSEKLLQPIVNLLENFSLGFTLLKSPKKIIACMVLSLMVWLTQAFSYHIMTFGCPGVELSFIQTATVMVIICFAISLPSVPGFWGLWEAGGIFALSLFSVARENAAGYTLANHVVQIIPVIIIGMISAFIIGFNIKQLYIERH